jgi:hypothetical protein
MPAPPSFNAIALAPDLMTSVRLESAVQRLGGRLSTLHYERDFLDALQKTPRFAIVDLGIEGVDVERMAETCRAAKIPLVAFGPHVDARGLRAARAAGVPFVYARSKFLADLNGIIEQALAAGETAPANG